MRCTLTALIFAVLTGYVPYSDNPIADPNKDALDMSVVGSWYWQEGHEILAQLAASG